MAKSGKSSSGSSRSSITGKYVTSKHAKSHPSTTQTSHKKSKQQAPQSGDSLAGIRGTGFPPVLCAGSVGRCAAASR